MSAPVPTPAAQEPTAPEVETPAPAAATLEPTPPAKPSLEDSLAALDPDTRAFVLGEVTGARNEAKGLRARLRDAEPKISEYDRLVEASKTELERAQEAAAKSDERASALIARAITAEVRALAADTFADPSDAVVGLGDVKKYVANDGDVDTKAIEADLAELLTRKPHWAKPGEQRMRPNPAQGVTGSSAPPDLDAQIEAATKARDFPKAIALKQQRAAELNKKP